jgi:hypothetical protein
MVNFGTQQSSRADAPVRNSSKTSQAWWHACCCARTLVCEDDCVTLVVMSHMLGEDGVVLTVLSDLSPSLSGGPRPAHLLCHPHNHPSLAAALTSAYWFAAAAQQCCCPLTGWGRGADGAPQVGPPSRCCLHKCCPTAGCPWATALCSGRISLGTPCRAQLRPAAQT